MMSFILSNSVKYFVEIFSISAISYFILRSVLVSCSSDMLTWYSWQGFRWGLTKLNSIFHFGVNMAHIWSPSPPIPVHQTTKKMIQSQTEHQTVSKWLTNKRSFTANCGQKLENRIKKSGNYFHIRMNSIIMLDGKYHNHYHI